MIGLLIEWSVCLVVGWLGRWLVGWLVGWLVDFFDRLVG